MLTKEHSWNEKEDKVISKCRKISVISDTEINKNYSKIRIIHGRERNTGITCTIPKIDKVKWRPTKVNSDELAIKIREITKEQKHWNNQRDTWMSSINRENPKARQKIETRKEIENYLKIL